MSEEMAWQHTGTYSEVSDKISGNLEDNPDIKKALSRKEHLWIILTTYQVKNPELIKENGFIADKENLINITGIGCLFCENEYSKKLAIMKCRGDLNLQ